MHRDLPLTQDLKRRSSGRRHSLEACALEWMQTERPPSFATYDYLIRLAHLNRES
jgi:hypothetical protein